MTQSAQESASAEAASSRQRGGGPGRGPGPTWSSGREVGLRLLPNLPLHRLPTGCKDQADCQPHGEGLQEHGGCHPEESVGIWGLSGSSHPSWNIRRLYEFPPSSKPGGAATAPWMSVESSSPGRRQRILVLRGWPFLVGLPQALSPSTMQRPHLLVHTCKEAGSFITHLSRPLLPRETQACQACSLHNFLEKQGSQSFCSQDPPRIVCQHQDAHQIAVFSTVVKYGK